MRLLCLFILLLSCQAEELKPLMNIPGEIVIQSDFSKEGKPDKKIWKPSQATQWIIKDGVLHGQQSTSENQAKKAHHKGLEPRICVPETPKEFIAKFSIRFFGGKSTPIVPFIEFGHHIVRMRIQDFGVDLVADYESMQLAKSNFKWKMDQWYECMAELKEDEFVIQIKDGPTLYAKHKIFTQPAPSGSDGLGAAGPRGGFLQLDNITIWKAAGEHKNWAKTRSKFPSYTPVKVREKPDKTNKSVKKRK